MQPADEVVRRHFNLSHSVKRFSELVSYVTESDVEIKVVMKTTGHYHEPILKAFLEDVIFISAVNPTLIKRHDNYENPLHKVQ